MTWPAERIERWPIDRLVPYANNARTHSSEQIDEIVAAIREWGWTNPVLIDDDGTIIAGHGRVMAAQRLAIAEIPVMIARGWSDEQKRAYAIADNKIGLNAGWNLDLLTVELNALDGLQGLVGFSGDELAKLLGPPVAPT